MLVEFLRNDLESRSKKNAKYSLRSYAKKLSIHPATLSSIMSNKRPLTPQTASRILDRLEVSLETKRRLLFATMESAGSSATSAKAFVLQRDVFDSVSSWEHDAILCLLQLPNFKASVYGIANRLNLGTGVVMAAIERLRKVGLVEKQAKTWKVVHSHLETAPEVSRQAIQRVHKQYLEKALGAVENQAASQREISGVTMAVDAKKLPEAREMIKEFRKQLCRFLENGEKNSVFRLNVQLFPLD